MTPLDSRSARRDRKRSRLESWTPPGQYVTIDTTQRWAKIKLRKSELTHQHRLHRQMRQGA